MKRILLATALLLISWCQSALAVPDTVSARVTDVTTSSFSIVWMTDVPADAGVEIYTDANMSAPLTEGVVVTPMPDASQEVAAAAKVKGIMQVRVSGLTPNTRYYARSVTRDPANPDSIGYSATLEIRTAKLVAPFTLAQDGSLQGFANDLATMKVYLQPNDQQAVPGLGDLLVLETRTAGYPLSAFVGAGSIAPEGVIDLNNLFGPDFSSLWVKGGETTQISFYRGGTLATLLHFRRLPINSGMQAASEPAKGFYADINLDGKIDDADFQEFKQQYRTAPNDGNYNPDYKFVQNLSGKIDAQDFASFAKQYGRTGVQ
jgi:hypothetical protein